ncbi:hypothetical protein T05_7186 [Trichinella murrelli]|uniref:Uncharacterized protein n=1 Tax=Trichinella murrelli TaxID=144512 RepID=A0A0V0TB91_9BILA|nr:hypothetical protein T05_7186 [Trichinella murrelli]
MKNFVLCVLFSAILVSGQIFTKKDSNAVDSEDALKQKIQDVESWIENRKDKAKNPGKFDELLFAASLKCPSECLKFIDQSPKMHELCLLKCQKKLRGKPVLGLNVDVNEWIPKKAKSKKSEDTLKEKIESVESWNGKKTREKAKRCITNLKYDN